ncbi:MAG: proline iminopeptidase-family hydrolase [Candidatus Nanohaloarchaea archaeon]
MVENYFSIPHREGYWQIEDYELYYRAFGSGDEVLVGLHGGPGFPSPYLAPLAQHGNDKRTVYLYDQFGCGRSDRPAEGDVDRYTVEHYREELEKIRQTLGVDKVTLYGSSWGSVLAQEYVLEYPDNVDKLIMSGALHDMQEAKEAMRAAMKEELSEEEIKKVEQLESERAFDDSEYWNILEKVFLRRVIRMEERPLWFRKSIEGQNTTLKGIMEGVNEFMLSETARLSDWSSKGRLSDIQTPTLIISGEYDEISPDLARDMVDRMPNAQLELIEEASHSPFWEKPEQHYEAVEKFLSAN